MKKTTSLLLSTVIALSTFSATAMADATKGKRFYMHKLKSSCKKAGIRNGGIFAAKHNRRDWQALKTADKLQAEWMKECPKATKKIKKMRKKDIKNLYDFVWKYASDGETPTCG